MSEKDYKLFLYDILEEFYENELVLYAILKSLENIGEAVKSLPELKELIEQIKKMKEA